jgi:hypothetical protein
VVRVGAVTGDDDDDAADGGAKPPVRRRERPARGLPQTGGEDVPPVGYVVAALAFVALGGWLRGWERIVRGGR